MRLIVFAFTYPDYDEGPRGGWEDVLRDAESGKVLSFETIEAALQGTVETFAKSHGMDLKKYKTDVLPSRSYGNCGVQVVNAESLELMFECAQNKILDQLQPK
ncbi:MAG: hypothetical protein G01um10143_258 [Parcubacteria group bacterium Gr01-1014_3]|nr:MAG: hypothetical protein G01um10143_258 [Parcubacteria group bacterium Gr01-1014_3]